MTQEMAVRPEERGRTVSQLATADQLTVEGLLSIRKTVTEVLEKVLKKGVDYGLIPGTQKPGLWKPGAEKLCSVFRLAREISTTERVLPDGHILYEAKVRLVHGPSGILVGEGVGVASSLEGRWGWRSPVCPEEFAEAEAAGRARRKWKRGKKGERGERGERAYTVDQVRTDPEDVRQTLLAMSTKRAFVDATRCALAASDVFEAPEAAMAERDDDRTEEVYSSLPAGPEGLPFALHLVPCHPDGQPVFTGAWAKKDWKILGALHAKAFRAGTPDSPLSSILGTDRMHEKLREQAQAMATKIEDTITGVTVKAAPPPEPTLDDFPDDEFDLDDVPF